MWHEWIYKEIGQARLMLNDLESCQHLVEARRISHKVKHSLDIVQTGVWELGARLHEARMNALRNPPHAQRCGSNRPLIPCPAGGCYWLTTSRRYWS